MNPLGWILNSLKVHPEPVSLPEGLEDATPLELAEARSRLATFAQVATELRRLVDAELASKIPTALRYGEDVYRPSNGRGSAKVTHPEGFWARVGEAVAASDDAAALLSALFPANSVRLTALPKVAALLEVDPEAFKDTFIDYDSPSSPLSVMPRSKAPKFLQDMEEGEIR